MNKYYKLKEVKDLLDKGLINQEEFDRLKNEVLFEAKSQNESISNKSNSFNAEQNNNPSISTNEKVNNGKIFYTFFIILFCALIIGLNIKNNPSKDKTIENTNSSTQPATTENNVISNSCAICGRSFEGGGYEEVSEGNWQLLKEGIGSICSPQCGIKSTQNLIDVAKKYGVDVENNSGNYSNNQKCSRCMGHYIDGFCNMCGAASTEKVSESMSNRQNCSLCNGKGVIGGSSYGDYSTCPECNGSGKLTY